MRHVKTLTIGMLAVAAAMATATVRAESVPGVKNATYSKECGSCHMAYPPALLPARSWQKLMTGLHEHFNENAELPADTAKTISDYLAANAADKVLGEVASKVMRSAGQGTPLRISELEFFKHEHRKLTAAQVQNNLEVKSFSRCQACHTQAEKGSFGEREIKIPGFGSVED